MFEPPDVSESEMMGESATFDPISHVTQPKQKRKSDIIEYIAIPKKEYTKLIDSLHITCFVLGLHVLTAIITLIVFCTRVS